MRGLQGLQGVAMNSNTIIRFNKLSETDLTQNIIHLGLHLEYEFIQLIEDNYSCDGCSFAQGFMDCSGSNCYITRADKNNNCTFIRPKIVVIKND